MEFQAFFNLGYGGINTPENQGILHRELGEGLIHPRTRHFTQRIVRAGFRGLSEALATRNAINIQKSQIVEWKRGIAQQKQHRASVDIMIHGIDHSGPSTGWCPAILHHRANVAHHTNVVVVFPVLPQSLHLLVCRDVVREEVDVQAGEETEKNEPGGAKDKEAANLWVPLCPCSIVRVRGAGFA